MKDLSRRKAAWCVAAFVAFALAARLPGVGYSLPHEAHPDERVWDSQVARARGGSGQLIDNFARFYPDLVPRLSALATSRVDVPVAGSPDEHRAAAGRELLRLRILGLMISLLAIPAVYRIARIVLSRRAALFAAALAATSAMVQWYSQQARPHAAAAALVAIALVLLVAARRRPTLPRWMGAGLACAVALSTLQSAAALLPAFLVAAVLGEARGLKRWAGPAVGLLMLLVALPFLPALATGGTAPAADAGGTELQLFGHRVFTDSFDGSGFPVLFWRAWEIDPLIFVLVLLGIVLLVVQRPRELLAGTKRRDILVLAAHAVPYGLLIGVYARSFDRFLLPLLPVAAVLAAGAVFGWKHTPRRGAVLLAVVLVALQAAYALRLSVWRATQDTVGQAGRWLEDHVQPSEGAIATLPYIDVPVLRKPASVRADAWQSWLGSNVWQRYLGHVPPDDLERRGYSLAALPLPRDESDRDAVRSDPGPHLAQSTARYVIVARAANNPLVEALQAQIATRGTLVTRITPWLGDETDSPNVWTGVRGPPKTPWAWTLFRTRSPGPILEIWRL